MGKSAVTLAGLVVLAGMKFTTSAMAKLADVKFIMSKMTKCNLKNDFIKKFLPFESDNYRFFAYLRIGDKGIRTPDLTGAIRALYQLSYIPI